MSGLSEFNVQFDFGTIKHLGLQMYSTLPPVIGELVSNSWDADASNVSITIPETSMLDGAEIVIQDDGCGMSDKEVQEAYLVIGRDRRKDNGDAPTPMGRKVMGRKGIGKFSAFGIVSEIEIETVKAEIATRFILRYEDFERAKNERKLTIPARKPTGSVQRGTRIVLKGFTKYQNRPIDIQALRRGIARRFSIIGERYNFQISINNDPITIEERDLTRLLDKEVNGNPYKWDYNRESIDNTDSNKVSGWIGALNRSAPTEDGIQRGIAIMARGKLVQEPFLFDAVVGQQYALSYLVGELYADFVDETDDTIGTSRNALVWDTPINSRFKEWGQQQVNRIAREWAEKRNADQTEELKSNDTYKRFLQKTERFGSQRVRKLADAFIKKAIKQNPLADASALNPVVNFAIDYMEFNAFEDAAERIEKTEDIPQVVNLFREWEMLEAKEMARVTEGRIKTIKKLKQLIDENALEVPTIHNFFKEFPWVLDPRWTLIADEKRYSDLLKSKFPEPIDLPEQNRRIDFLCVAEGQTLVVVEIKRPTAKASIESLTQIEEYVSFMRNYIKKTTDESLKKKEVIGYLLVGGRVDTWRVSEKADNLANSKIYIRLYADLLRMAERLHKEFLERYDLLEKKERQQL